MTFVRMRAAHLLAMCAVALAYDQSLSDCKAVAAQFRSTCAHGDYDTPSTSMEDMASTTTTCENKPACIPDGSVSGQTCTWERRLCVTCRREDRITLIRVQTNNLPDRAQRSRTLDKPSPVADLCDGLHRGSPLHAMSQTASHRRPSSRRTSTTRSSSTERRPTARGRRR